MLNKLLTESYSRVRSKADEFSKQVTHQAVKAREALGIPSLLHRSDACQLQRQLENQASQASNLNQLHDLYVKWIAQILMSSEADAPLYFDYPEVSNTFPFDLASLMLGTSAPEKQQSSKTWRNVPPGDLSSQSSWIAPYHQKPQFPSISGTTSPHGLSADQPSSSLGRSISSSEVDVTKNTTDSSFEIEQSNREKTRTEQFPPQSPINGMTFRQVFLRSQSLEITLLSIARLEEIRSKLVGPLDEDGMEASTRGALHRLMSLTMKGGKKVHMELLFLFCSVDLTSEAWEVQLRHLVELAAILKIDWQDQYYQDKISRISTEIEILEQDLHQITIPGTPLVDHSSGNESSSLTWTRNRIGSSSSATESSSEEQEVLMNAKAAQLEKYSNTSQRIAEWHIEVSRLLEQRIQRSLVVKSAISKRMAALFDSANSLGQKFLNLQTKATDRTEHVVQESEMATADVERQLVEAMSQKEAIDSELQSLEVQKSNLLLQLKDLETKIFNVAAKQRKAHDLVESLFQHRDSLRKMFDYKTAIASKLKRQSALHQLDMKNMQILIEQSKQSIEESETHHNEELHTRKTKMFQQVETTILDHFRFEVERLDFDCGRLTIGLKVLEDLWESIREKEEQLKHKQEQLLFCQSEYQQMFREIRALGGAIDSGAEHHPSSTISIEFAEKTKQLGLLRAGVEALVGGLDILRAGFAQAQWRCLEVSRHLDEMWHRINLFVEVASNYMQHGKDCVAFQSIAPVVKFEAPNTLDDNDDFVHVGETAKDDDQLPGVKQEYPLCTSETETLGSTIRTIAASAQSIYTRAKNAMKAKAHLVESTTTPHSA